MGRLCHVYRVIRFRSLLFCWKENFYVLRKLHTGPMAHRISVFDNNTKNHKQKKTNGNINKEC